MTLAYYDFTNIKIGCSVGGIEGGHASGQLGVIHCPQGESHYVHCLMLHTDEVKQIRQLLLAFW